MYCWNCGKEIEDHSVFCPHCGMKQAAAPEPPKEKKRTFLLPVICAAICVGALLGMILLLSGDREDPAPQIQATQATAAPAATEVKPAPEATVAEGSGESKNETEKESHVDPYSAELPDLASFLNTEYTQNEWGYTHYVTCLIDKDNEQDMVKAILDLLQEPRYQLKLMDMENATENGKQCTNYTFEYTGKNENIDWVYLKAGGKYHVKLTQMAYSGSQTAIIMYSFPEFYLEDPGRNWDEEAASSGTAQKKTTTEKTDTKPTTSSDDTIVAGETIKVRGDTTIRIKAGTAVELTCTYDENPQYDVYEWSITSGGSKISINKESGKTCKVTGLSAGTAQIKMVYKYGYTGSNILTGNPEPREGSKTSTYTIIVE